MGTRSGPEGGGSKDLHTLLRKIAATAGERVRRAIGANSIVEAKAVVKNRIFRSVGIAAVREAARLKRERLGIVLGGDGNAAAARRNFARQNNENIRNEYLDLFGLGPRDSQ